MAIFPNAGRPLARPAGARGAPLGPRPPPAPPPTAPPAPAGLRGPGARDPALPARVGPAGAPGGCERGEGRIPRGPPAGSAPGLPRVVGEGPAAPRNCLARGWVAPQSRGVSPRPGPPRGFGPRASAPCERPPRAPQRAGPEGGSRGRAGGGGLPAGRPGGTVAPPPGAPRGPVTSPEHGRNKSPDPWGGYGRAGSSARGGGALRRVPGGARCRQARLFTLATHPVLETAALIVPNRGSTPDLGSPPHSLGREWGFVSFQAPAGMIGAGGGAPGLPARPAAPPPVLARGGRPGWFPRPRLRRAGCAAGPPRPGSPGPGPPHLPPPGFGFAPRGAGAGLPSGSFVTFGAAPCERPRGREESA